MPQDSKSFFTIALAHYFFVEKATVDNHIWMKFLLYQIIPSTTRKRKSKKEPDRQRDDSPGTNPAAIIKIKIRK
jgi:hypothetical protein